jgi:DNA polymerase-3 subunit gamma/tau
MVFPQARAASALLWAAATTLEAVSLALYRRYRPETFEEVIGQDHVTAPLQRALRNGRVNHAYLFSGPRGCGKTTSARILARCLNCEQGPTPTPCGQCRSCSDLARGGPGSIDVIEIDAASHGGVDDARDLRERAFFAPVSARYKIYILDEAHMVSSAGFNALLKVVEEPPPHLKFIFATTEPEKVIGTIRSRTHHYPFRLVPPGVLRDYVAELCEREEVKVEPEALPLVVRAGAGSVRDSLSVLDQLLGAAGEEGVTYQMAVGLLGYTDSALLDEAVAAFAGGDGSAAFRAVDHVVEGGHDPRRFLADLLERLRDLIILSAVPDAPEKGLVSAPADRLARMRDQAAAFGPAQLSRTADLVSEGLLEMRGATAPRLLLELVCARVLLPGADDSARGLGARIERLERSGVGVASGAVAAPQLAVRPSTPVAPQAPPAAQPGGMPTAEQAEPQAAAPATPSGLEPPPWKRDSGEGAKSRPQQAQPQSGHLSAAQSASPPQQDRPRQTQPGQAQPNQAQSRGSAAPAQQPQSAPTGADSGAVRRAWPQVVDAVGRRSKVAWVMVSQNVSVVGVEGRVLQLGFTNPGLRDNFPGSRSEEVLREALREITGTDWKLSAIVDPSAGNFGQSGPPPASPPSGGSFSSSPNPGQSGQFGAAPSGGGGFATPPAVPQERTPSANPAPAESSAPTGTTAAAPGGPPDWAAPPESGADPGAAPAWAEPDMPDPDDEDVPDARVTARDLLISELGATVLEDGARPD